MAATQNKYDYILFGGAGLVGSAILSELSNRADIRVLVVDNDLKRMKALECEFRKFDFVASDIENSLETLSKITQADFIIVLAAVVMGESESEFISTRTLSKTIIEFLSKVKLHHIVLMSSQTVNSIVSTNYSRSKKEQEDFFVSNSNKVCVIRPTLMFGRNDTKHLQFVIDFCSRLRILPLPGNGKYVRQPLYSKDVAKICINAGVLSVKGVYDICGLEKVNFVDLINRILIIRKTNCIFLFFPIKIYKFLIKTASLVFPQFIFGPSQVDSLVADEAFSGVDTSLIFKVSQTPLNQALLETFEDS